MKKIDKQLKKLEKFTEHVKKSLDNIKEIQINDVKEIEKTKDKLIKTIWSFKDMFEFDFTKNDLKNDDLDDLIELCRSLIEEIEKRYGLEQEEIDEK
jgi:hypothetical protein